MRVLFLGHTGIDKRSCIERLARRCLASAKLPQDLENIRSRRHLRVFHLEDAIGGLVAGDYIAYLDLFNSNRQASIWSAAWKLVQGEISQSSPENIFISLHATYFRKNRFFSVANNDLIRDFNPNFIITSVDDAFECWHRIATREKEHPRGTRLRLRDILLWRTVEIMVGDFLVPSTEIPHYVVATKHPAEMVRRLIFEPASKRVYASFPISSTRSQNSTRQPIDDFRRSLHESFTVFDPLTIDERILLTALESRNESDDEVQITLNMRWAPWFGGEYEALATPYDANYPLILPVDQIEEATIDIDRQIEARDYRLIDSVQALAAFRPNFGDHHARGVNAEIQYAAQTVGIPVHLTWNDLEDGTYGNSPFGDLGTRHMNIPELISALGG